ncbi:MAG TPA: excalibur calcium-binding domain-containing protein [Jiangellaceae bacterium]|nr:excalibur calcium-binding domain-containing protein [Jiangellaceae bacterium]
MRERRGRRRFRVDPQCRLLIRRPQRGVVGGVQRMVRAECEAARSNSGGSVHYQNCNAARAAGAAPVRAGDPGWRRGLDREGEGPGCE